MNSQNSKISPPNLSLNSSRVSISDVYNDYSTKNPLYFLAHFGYLPHLLVLNSINCSKANDWILKNSQKSIQEHYLIRSIKNQNRKANIELGVYFLEQDIMICLEDSGRICRIFYKYSDERLVENYRKQMLRYKMKNVEKSKISILMHDGCDFYLQKMPINKPKLDIKDNYNLDFEAVHQRIIDRLNKKDDKGVLLLHGQPGTGKTTYLRYLINSVKKNVIFFPQNMAQQIDGPHFIKFLIANPNTILVIEDAENIITNRSLTRESGVSSLLNISDGLLSDFLNIQLICSFNTDISNIDEALVRKGRLIANYEFKALEMERAKSLSSKIGVHTSIDRPMTLAEIYHQKDKGYTKASKGLKIGF